MDNVVRVKFVEVDEQWRVTLVSADGEERPGEPFQASAHERFSKLEQVMWRLRDMGYRALSTPAEANERQYVIDVVPIQD